MGRSTQVVLIAIGSILIGLGLGPLTVGGVNDLFGMAAISITATNIVIVVLILVTFTLGFIASGRGIPESLTWVRLPGIRMIVAGSVAVACLASFVSTIDSGNTSAWRNATQLTPGPGVNKRQIEEFGGHFARLSVDGSSSSSHSVGTIPVDWRAWFAGGRSDVLLRSHASAASTEVDDCDGHGDLRIVAAGQDTVLNEVAVSLRGICGQWQLFQIDLPRGATELQFVLDRSNDGGETAIDFMIVVNRPIYSWIWALFSVFAVGLVLATVWLLSVNLRENVRSPETKTGLNPARGRKRGLITVGAIVLFAFVSNAFIYCYVSQEKTIYTWDFSGYWMSSRNVSEFLGGAERKTARQQLATSQASDRKLATDEPDRTVPGPGALAALIRNIRFSEYNVSSNLPVALVMTAFGGSRMVYELSLINIYALAAVLMLIVAVRASARDQIARWPDWWPMLPVAAVLCFVPFWVPIVRGYMGVSVAALNLAALWLYFKQPVRQTSTISLLMIGVLLLAGVILQRWNAYWVVGFFVMAFVDGVSQLIERRQINLLAFLRAMRAPMISGFAAFFLFAAIAWPKVVRTLTTDYADLYSAFQEDDSLVSALARQVDAFGAGIYVILILSFVFLVTNVSTRRIALLLGVQLLCGFLLFSRTQTMGPHQYFLILPGLLVILSLGLATAISSNIRSIAISGASAIVLVLAFGIASGQAVFLPTDDSAYMPRSRLLSQSYRPPLVSQDLDEFIRLTEYIDQLMGVAPEGQGVYVLAGSATLNAVHFKSITASTGATFKSADRVLGSSVVDKRDGFPRGIFDAYIVVSSDPIQLSRRPSDQQVIRVPAERMFNGTGIGAAFERLPLKFRLDGEVDAVVFRRSRPNTVDEIADLSEALRKFYPDRPEVYQ